jgi:hypothetical protein
VSVAAKPEIDRARRDPDRAAILADLDPELHRLPLGIPVGILGERWLGNGAPRAILFTSAIGRKTRTLGRVGSDERLEECSTTSPTG